MNCHEVLAFNTSQMPATHTFDNCMHRSKKLQPLRMLPGSCCICMRLSVNVGHLWYLFPLFPLSCPSIQCLPFATDILQPLQDRCVNRRGLNGPGMPILAEDVLIGLLLLLFLPSRASFSRSIESLYLPFNNLESGLKCLAAGTNKQLRSDMQHT